MVRFRLILALALMLATLTALGLWFAPIDGWASVVAKAGAAVAGTFALGSLTLFVFTLFPTKDDLWDTNYFRYMRAFWGERWGGSYARPLQISTCKANWLSMWTALLWLTLLGSCGLLIYLTIAPFTAGINNMAILNYDGVSGGKLIIRLFMWVIMIGGMVAGSLTVLLFTRVNKSFPILSKVGGLTYLILIGSAFAVALVVAPILAYGALAYLKVIGIGFGILAAFAAVCAILMGIIWLGIKFSRLISKGTVPGQLAAEQSRGWKGKICPLIIQKEKEKTA